jgi:hypothetical protein
VCTISPARDSIFLIPSHISEFSRYLAASGHEERLRLSPQIRKFRKYNFSYEVCAGVPMTLEKPGNIFKKVEIRKSLIVLRRLLQNINIRHTSI